MTDKPSSVSKPRQGVGGVLHRWRWVLLGVVMLLLGVASALVVLPLQGSDKARAARYLVGWIVEARSIPGLGEGYPDAQFMPRQKRFFVICEFIPQDAALSDDPRVQRVTSEEYENLFKKYGYEDTDYMTIELKSESGNKLVVEFSNYFGKVAGHAYRFEFFRTFWGLRAKGKLLWVS